MAGKDGLITSDTAAYLQAQEAKSLLRFVTCGSVDDGKSTLIGRLLYESKMIYDDQLAAIEKDSKTGGSNNGGLDLALLVDGLAAEREQGITIDVAYRFFSTDKRKFIVADTPGHEQYTRNMATGASTADVAVLLLDARESVQVQSRRHAYIATLLGIRHIVVAINKMDLVDFSEARYRDICTDVDDLASLLQIDNVVCIPVSALDGDNVIEQSERMSWYDGPTLLGYLECVDVSLAEDQSGFRFPVQWVNRPNLNFRGYAGTIASGRVHQGDSVIVLPSGQRSKIRSIVTYEDSLAEAVTGQAVTLVLEDELDISRGDVICHSDSPAEQSDQFAAHVVWMSQHQLFPGRQYLIKTDNNTVSGSITELKFKIDVNTLAKSAGKTLEMNEIGYCNISLARPIIFTSYKENRRLGSFVVVDRQTNETVGVGMLDFSLRRAGNVVWQDLDIGKLERAAQKHQKPCVLWFTGLSGSGKSTIANLVEKRLYDLGRHTYTLDGDNVRHGLNNDLGFKDADRVENIRRVSEVAKLMADSGLIVLCAFISPFRDERRMARQTLADGEFIEIYVNTPIEVAEQRDVKGLYAKARRGEIVNFTGIDSEYQVPDNAEISIDTTSLLAEKAAEQVVEYLQEHGYLDIP